MSHTLIYREADDILRAVRRSRSSLDVDWVRSPKLLAHTALAAAVCLIGACATTAPAPTHSREVLDENTGTTLILVQRPIVLARPRNDVAAHTRDYLTLVAAEEDRSGRYTAWLIVHRWSTVDPRMQSGTGAEPETLHLIADDREFALKPIEPPPAVLQRGDLLFAPRSADARSGAYAIDDATLRYIAGARRLLARIGETDPLPAYAIWEDGRESIRQLLVDVAAP